MQARVGIGFDSHRYVPGRTLVLGGVEIPHELGLEGHSDADALAHAISDAVLGACCLGDLGEHFPASDPRWKDASSLDLLKRVAALALEAGFRVVNVDSVLIAERPRLKAYRVEMGERLAGALGVEPKQVGVKLKSAEGMGSVGRVEGVAAQAVALVETTP